MAGTTGLEPAASAVTGQRSNQLNYVPKTSSTICLRALDACVHSPALSTQRGRLYAREFSYPLRLQSAARKLMFTTLSS
jgi:hypothetical protein